MIIDVTGVSLFPGENGKQCLGNGKHVDAEGVRIECCCDECDYMLCCIPEHSAEDCKSCTDPFCPRKNG